MTTRLIVPTLTAVLMMASGPVSAAGSAPEAPQSAMDMLLHGTPSQRAAEARFRASLLGRQAVEHDTNTRRHGRHGGGAVPSTVQP